jgi:hypothetical protein
MADDISYLPPKERSKRYRELAADARREATAATEGAVRESYLIIAGQFDRLASVADGEDDGGRGLIF